MLMFIANISISNNLYIVRILFLFFAFFLGRRCKFKLYFPIQRRQFRFQYHIRQTIETVGYAEPHENRYVPIGYFFPRQLQEIAETYGA